MLGTWRVAPNSFNVLLGWGPVAGRCRKVFQWVLLLASFCQSVLPCECAQCAECAPHCNEESSAVAPNEEHHCCRSQRNVKRPEVNSCEVVPPRGCEQRSSGDIPHDVPCQKLRALDVVPELHVQESWNVVSDASLAAFRAQPISERPRDDFNFLADCSIREPSSRWTQGVRLQV